ncbi:hypothetical protein K9N68_11680 [Kovacikia minuta CCNUW1]|uniref:hypothetical protein n=1 Tax=Kovacikia minuta TaxID=2931930 RepID=UPI001CCD62FB|nr:hypothetical protein [Kovacikia minuta]UBF28469.1 hypothetical protein K9N68_11680 [Kovacikia minuta CCNUW1]
MSLEFTAELTADDLLILEQHRLERLRSFFGETLRLCFIYLDKKNTLAIHCSEPWIVDQLLNEMNELRWYSWMVVGASQISICFAQEEIHKTKTRKPGKKSLRVHT